MKRKKKLSVLQPFKNTNKIIEWQSLGKTYKCVLFIFVLYPWPVPERAFMSTHCVTIKKGSWIEQHFFTYVIASKHNGLKSWAGLKLVFVQTQMEQSEI